MNLRDTAERLFWTFVVTAIGTATGSAVFTLDLAVWQIAAMAGLGAVANVVVLIGRDRLAFLPSPGQGLPGLPTHDERGDVGVIELLLIAILLLTFLTCARVFGWI